MVDNLPQTDHDSIVFHLIYSIANYKKADFDIYQDTLLHSDLAKTSTVYDWWCQWKDLFFAVVNDTIPKFSGKDVR